MKFKYKENNYNNKYVFIELEDVHFEEISGCRNISFLWGGSMISGIFYYMLVAKQYAHKTNNELESKWNSYCFNFNVIAI